MILLIGVFIWLIIEVVFFILHRNPLNEEEILKLSQKRTRKYIKKKYTFNNVPITVNKQFKSSLKPNGCWYNVNESLVNFPSYIAALLKGKKHEWVVLAIEKDGIVYGFYANKGYDNSSVSFNCDLDYIMRKCEEYGCSTIMRFHNHPNENPSRQTCLLASEQDKSSALWCSGQVNHSYNWLDFVCERGNFIKFFEQYSPSFIPKVASNEYIQTENNISQLKNYKLHRELGVFHYSRTKEKEKISNNYNSTKQQIQKSPQTPKKKTPMREKIKIALIVVLCLSLKWGIIGLITGNDTKNKNIDSNSTTTANSVVEESVTNETTLENESSTYIEDESNLESTSVPTISDKEIMISQFQSLGLTKEEAEDAQEIFENVGITKISDVEVRLQTTNGVDGEVQYLCNLNNFDRKTQEIGLRFVIMRRKVQRIDICQFPHGNTVEFYKSLTMFDGIEKGDSVVLYYRKLKGYLQVDENSFGYRAIYDCETHSVRKY